ncbi:MAG: CocE/NonD family hydrolase [Planctomycetota bacterium]|nr:CocE/NonD family hydrolase [Planctomycetota bacterium]
MDENRNYKLIFFVLGICLFGQQSAGQIRSDYVRENYTKSEYKIKVRDGVHLHTVVFTPQDRSRKYPILINRTPYSCRPYGRDQMPGRIGPSECMEREGYIFVKQDVRGRWMSEGKYDNMRPHVAGNRSIDESSDTYDSIEWLLNNIQGNNGKVGLWGISYPGFYAAAALPEAHPALVASSPQAPISDFFFDDFHHQGAYLLMYWMATPVFGYQHKGPTQNQWYKMPQVNEQDAYRFYFDLGPLSNTKKYYGKDNFFWQQLVDHPNYDEFWQRRGILPHLKKVHTNVMTVGGWFDAEDLYGPLKIYQTIEKNNPGTFNCLVMGPWSHGDWSQNVVSQKVGNISFGENLSEFYQKEVEAPFFAHFLKGENHQPKFEALVFDTGKKHWTAFQKWPPQKSKKQNWFFSKDRLSFERVDSGSEYSEFVSDPAQPVPYRKREDLKIRFTPRPYMTDDQRFASRRKDVLVFQSDVLQEGVTVVGPITANLKVSTSGTAADWIVKLIDVYPEDTMDDPRAPGIKMGGYQQMVRSEVLRGRFRNSFSKPEPFVPGQITDVQVPLQDVFHTFKRGHRIMVHVQSTWFPLIDRNPQKYVENIFKASEFDFQKANHRVYFSGQHPSTLTIRTLK